MNAPKPNIYDPANAAALVQFAADAYNVAASRQSAADPVCLPTSATAIWDSVTDTHVKITQSATDIVIAFRGTADVRNWFTDLDARMVVAGSGGVKVHAGFHLALSMVFPQVEKIIKQAAAEKKRIWLTGHSLGGALALYCAWCVIANEKANPLTGVYTFGQPRVGNAAFRDSWPFKAGLDACTFRIVNAVDLVPHLPWLCGRFRHAGHEVFYDGLNLSGYPDFRMDRSAIEYCLSDIFAMASEWLNPTSAEQWLADHHVAKYQALFKQLPHTAKDAAPGASAFAPGDSSKAAPEQRYIPS